MKSILLINNPSEIGAGTRGASLGFQALKTAGWKKENNLLQTLETANVQNNNEALYEADLNPNAHRIKAICEVFEHTGEALKMAFDANKFPLVIGGDHSVAAGTISGIKKAHPDKKLGVVWIDAHADLHTPYTSPSGNIHGMPLAIALAEDNLEERKNDPAPQTIQEWNNAKEIFGISPKIIHEDLVFFGLRDTEAEEDAIISRNGIRNFTVDEVRSRGISATVQEAVERLNNCDIVYLSFDVDSMDPAVVSHGTGTPVPHGFTPNEAVSMIKLIFERLPVCCFEMVEINPTLDEKGNKMAEVAFEILEQVTEFIYQNS
ncbi:MAG: arginase [Flavobacteriales bacterium]|jgi:arginase